MQRRFCSIRMLTSNHAMVRWYTSAAAVVILSGGPLRSQVPSVPAENAAAPAMRSAIVRAIRDSFIPTEFSSSEDVADRESPDQAPAPPQTKPPENPQQPSLGDLGFPPSATQPNPQQQAQLNRRTRMLKTHQRLGLITTIPLVATVITGSFAGGKATSSTTRDLHAALGSVTGGLYFTTAYFSIFAPKPPGVQTRGPIRWHKALAWIHGPGMILTPVLGALAFEQKSQGEKVHGIASAHGAVGYVTAIAYGLAIVSVSVKF